MNFTERSGKPFFPWGERAASRVWWARGLGLHAHPLITGEWSVGEGWEDLRKGAFPREKKVVSALGAGESGLGKVEGLPRPACVERSDAKMHVQCKNRTQQGSSSPCILLCTV